MYALLQYIKTQVNYNNNNLVFTRFTLLTNIEHYQSDEWSVAGYRLCCAVRVSTTFIITCFSSLRLHLFWHATCLPCA